MAPRRLAPRRSGSVLRLVVKVRLCIWVRLCRRSWRPNYGSAVPKLVTLLGCGVASAVAASFNAPIAGVFFALEVVIGHYALSAFAPIVIAGVIGTIISQVYFGDFPAFIVPDQSLVFILGISRFCTAGRGLRSDGDHFSAVSRRGERHRRQDAHRPILKDDGGRVCVGVIALAFPEVMGVGYEATDKALNGRYELAMLIALLAAKVAATAISWRRIWRRRIRAVYVHGGDGRWSVRYDRHPDLPGAIFGHSAYTLSVLARFPAPSSEAPISTILIVFELTADYALTIAVMVAVVIASVITQQVRGNSFLPGSWNGAGSISAAAAKPA